MQTYVPRPRELAQEALEAYILKNGLGPRDKLPPEREMCAMWGLNRSTLRSAIARLTADGRLAAVQGSGTRVAPRVRRTLQDLQGFSEYARACGMKPESRLLSFSRVPCGRQFSRQFGRAPEELLYRIARLRLLDGMPVLLETAYIPCALAPGLEAYDLVNGSLFAALSEGYGLCLDHGQEKTSITAAAAEEADWLGVAVGAPAFWIVSETDAPDGTLIEACRSLGRADVMDLTSTLLWNCGPALPVAEEAETQFPQPRRCGADAQAGGETASAARRSRGPALLVAEEAGTQFPQPRRCGAVAQAGDETAFAARRSCSPALPVAEKAEAER